MTHKWKGKSDRKVVITDLKAEADKLLKLAINALDELGDFDYVGSRELTHKKTIKLIEVLIGIKRLRIIF